MSGTSPYANDYDRPSLPTLPVPLLDLMTRTLTRRWPRTVCYLCRRWLGYGRAKYMLCPTCAGGAGGVGPVVLVLYEMETAMADTYVPVWDDFVEMRGLTVDEELTFLEFLLLDLRIDDPDTLSPEEMETCYQQFRRWVEGSR